jgi:hypothetical protein
MLTVAQTASVNLATGVVTQGDLSARANLQLTLVGVGTETVANYRAALYRLNANGVEGTLAATCNSFSGLATAMLGSMSLNTTELVSAFTDLQTVRQGEQLKFELLVWDASPGVLVFNVWSSLYVGYEFALAGVVTASVNPITGTTVSWGNLKIQAGQIYVLNTTTGEYDPLTAAGVDGQQHLDVGDGILIP